VKNKNELALEILEYSRNSVLVKMPFLNQALFGLKFKEAEDLNFCSDGYYLYYKPNYILSEYKNDSDYFIRGILHIVMHFLFHHNIVNSVVDFDCWVLACDMAVENSINELNLDIKNNNTENQTKIYKEFNSVVSALNAETIYKYLRKQNYDSEKLRDLRFNFFKDEHGLWFAGDKEIKEAKRWEDISRQIQTDLQTYHKDTNNSLLQNLSEVNAHKISLKHFLKRFGQNEELIKSDPEAMDLVLYTYGLNMYKNIALVENQEFKEEKKIKDLVIAIDTSGSVKGELVSKFINYAYSILSDDEKLSNELNLYLIQCDDKIQELKQIKSKKELDEYINNLQLKGFGETDFRPVFECVNNLIEEKKIKDLKGLLYFTDGKGTYPQKKTNYKTAFIIYQKRYEEITVPPWVMKIELLEDDIFDEKFD